MSAPPPTYTEAAALSLTMAIVSSSPGPLLLLDGDLAIVAASASFYTAFDIDEATAPGQPLVSLGAGEWAAPRLKSLLGATLSGAARIEAYEMDLKREGQEPRRLVIHAQRLVYLDLENRRLLLAISDVTDARADREHQDETLRRNLVLLQEVRHRVANSLQIIASVLMQNARKTVSDETRGHLHDAHSRVMSVAALERQLSGSQEGEVDVHVYLTTLCASIAASMINDPTAVSLAVTGTGGVVDGGVSVSLGLIVTELVINALKHAFPEHRAGKITVDFQSRSPNWTLSVSDDGVGMPAEAAQRRPGLGTSIVQALAKQLQAVVGINPASPGTRVAITHSQIALVNDDVGDNRDASIAARPAA
jgi:two-component sensor histidine kinase